MPAIREQSRIAGATHDLVKLLSLPDDDCQVIVVSSRTQYILNNYAVEEVNYLSRYFTEAIGGGLIRVVQNGDSEQQTVEEIAQNFRLEVQNVTCDLVQAINNLTIAIGNLGTAGCCPPTGEVPPQQETVEGGDPPPGYVEYDPMIDERKCKLANMAIDDLLAVIDALIVNDIDAKVALGIGAVTALWNLIVASVASGPVGWALLGIGTILSLIGWFLVNSLDLGALKTLVENNRQDLICALYEATDNQQAFDDFKQVLSDAGADLVDLAFMDTLNLLNGLATLFFQPEGDAGLAIEQRLDGYPVTTSCDACAQPINFWRITPNDTFGGVDASGGFLGSGSVANDGSQFTIDAVLNTAGNWCISLIVQGFMDSQIGDENLNTPPCVLSGGTLELHSSMSTPTFLAGRRCPTGSCGEAIGTDQPPFTAQQMTGFLFVYYQLNAPFSLTFSVVASPDPCP